MGYPVTAQAGRLWSNRPGHPFISHCNGVYRPAVTQNPQDPYQPGPGQGRPYGQPQGGPQQPPYGQQQPPYGQPQPPYGQPQQPYGQHQQSGSGPKVPDPPAFAQKLSGIGANWGTGGPRPTMPTPKSVTWAFLLASAGSVIMIAYYLIQMITWAGYYGSFAGGFGIVGILLAAGVFVIAVMMRNGADWARITLAILTGLGALFALIALFSVGLVFTILGGFGALMLIFMLAEIAAFGGALFFLFQPDSNAYFKSASPGPGPGYPPPGGPQHFGS
jgi:hypothetical protein